MAADTWSRLAPAARNTLLILVIWEIVGRLDLIASGALPAVSEILLQFWHDRADYPQHAMATVQAAGIGFVIGNGIAIAAGLLFTLSPLALRVSRGLNIAIFALPPIAIAPILVLTLSDMTPRIVLAAMGCYFITMTATVMGLSQHDSRNADLIRAYGGGRWQTLRLVQLRGALPVILSGLRIAAPNAVLGAILAEFGGGGRWGLGSYLLGSLGRGDPARLWGIGLLATAIAAAGYLLFALLSRHLLGATRAVTLESSVPDDNPAHAQTSTARRVLVFIATLALPLLVWWAFVRLLNVPDLIAKTPYGVFDYLFLSDASANARSRLLAALAQTLPITLAGMLLGLLTAFALAMCSRLAPRLLSALMPVALVTQTMPLVALTPLLVLMLGRGYAVTLWITVSVTFFPAFVTIVQGLQLVPRAAQELPRAYGASAWREMRLVSIPASVPYLFAATRLTAPRALLGVMIAEWLATGTGLGNLLNQSRGYMDYGMIWSVASVSVVLSVVFYQVVVWVERRVLRHMGMTTTE